MRYSYSKNVVYNTFAWPEPPEEQMSLIEATAQNAHLKNDVAVSHAYGWPDDLPEEEIVARLFVRYHELKPNVSDENLQGTLRSARSTTYTT